MAPPSWTTAEQAEWLNHTITVQDVTSAWKLNNLKPYKDDLIIRFLAKFPINSAEHSTDQLKRDEIKKISSVRFVRFPTLTWLT